MMCTLLESRLHRVTVARTGLHCEGSGAVDETLLEAAGFKPCGVRLDERDDISGVKSASAGLSRP